MDFLNSEGKALPSVLNQDIKFNILISTWRRPDNTVYDQICHTLDSVMNQNYQNWKIYLIGDDYDDREEFNKIVNRIPKDKIVYENLDYARERCMFLDGVKNNKGELIIPDKTSLWHIAGANALNYGLSLCEKDGGDIIVKLDHDDLFKDFHLYNLFVGYKKFPEADFIFTSAAYGPRRRPIPKNSQNTKIEINNLLPKACETIHSSVSWRNGWRNFRYPLFNGEEYVFFDEPIDLKTPVDATYWNNLKKIELSYLYIPIVSVSKRDEHQNIGGFNK